MRPFTPMETRMLPSSPPPAVPVNVILTDLDRQQWRIELCRRAGLLPVSLPRPLPAWMIAATREGR